MKKQQKLYILLGILAVACIATFAVSHHEKKKEEIQNTDEVVLEIPSDTVTTLSWNNDGAEFAFHKDTDAETDTWIYDDDEDFPVSTDAINTLLDQFQSLGASFIITDVTDYDQYGLEDPTATIEIGTADATYEIKLGNYSTMDSERYIDIGDGNVYLVEHDPLDDYGVELSALIQNDEIPDVTAAVDIVFTGSQNYEAVKQDENTLTECDQDTWFVTEDDETTALDTTTVNTFLRALANMDLTEYATYTASSDDLSVYGLDDPDLIASVSYAYTDDDDNTVAGTYTVSFGLDPEELKESESSDDSSDSSVTVYARIGESDIVYEIGTSSDCSTLLNVSLDTLRHQEMFTGDTSEITSIDVTLEGETYTFTSETKDKETVWTYGDEEIEIDDLESAISSLNADSFLVQDASDKEEISFTLHLDNENVSERSYTIYRYDGSDCVIAIDGVPTAMVSRSQAMNIVEAVNAIVLN